VCLLHIPNGSSVQTVSYEGETPHNEYQYFGTAACYQTKHQRYNSAKDSQQPHRNTHRNIISNDKTEPNLDVDAIENGRWVPKTTQPTNRLTSGTYQKDVW
jgi:hypothetical protein